MNERKRMGWPRLRGFSLGEGDAPPWLFRGFRRARGLKSTLRGHGLLTGFADTL
jgi:hypothetical protein